MYLAAISSQRLPKEVKKARWIFTSRRWSRNTVLDGTRRLNQVSVRVLFLNLLILKRLSARSLSQRTNSSLNRFGFYLPFLFRYCWLANSFWVSYWPLFFSTENHLVRNPRWFRASELGSPFIEEVELTLISSCSISAVAEVLKPEP